MNQLHQMLLARRYQHTLTDLLQELLADREAVELFLEFHPNLWDELAAQGYTCLELSQSPQAQQIFSFLLEYNPEMPAYHAAYADALCMSKKYLDAADHYLTTTQLAPQVPDAFFYLGELYMILQHPECAVEALESATQLCTPNQPLANAAQRRLDAAKEATQMAV